MTTAAIYFFYAFVSLIVALSTSSSNRKSKSVIKLWFARAFWTLTFSTAFFGTAILLFQNNHQLLAYGMIAGRLPLLVALGMIAQVGWALLFFARPPDWLFQGFVVAGLVFVALHSTVWLGSPDINNGIVLWNVPIANTLTLNLFFLASFVTTGLILLRDSIKAHSGSKLSSLFLGLGLLLVGLGAAQISAATASKALFFQVFTAIGAVLIVSGVSMRDSAGLNIP